MLSCCHFQICINTETTTDLNIGIFILSTVNPAPLHTNTYSNWHLNRGVGILHNSSSHRRTLHRQKDNKNYSPSWGPTNKRRLRIKLKRTGFVHPRFAEYGRMSCAIEEDTQKIRQFLTACHTQAYRTSTDRNRLALPAAILHKPSVSPLGRHQARGNQ